MPKRQDDDHDYLVKLLLLGDSAVGKSSLLKRYCDDQFSLQHVLTIGVDFKSKIVKSGDKLLKLQIWDTAGQERFRTITPMYYRSANGIALVYDVTKTETFDNMRFWVKELKDADENVQKILIGNKVDLESERAVPYQKGVALAAEFGIPFFETSAKTNTNVDSAFMCIADLVRTRCFSDESGGNRGVSNMMSANRQTTDSSTGEQKKKCCR
eukprot:GHVR01151141.1.p1 GENE.GHVR01151141.1~~GHVR01151141.1.p1  ORF type:complete len:212 (+),score=40.14 GHVR01151141.1:88-723(+)